MPHLLRSLRHRNYQLFFGGQLISLTGTWMQSVAESWLVYRLTGSSALLGFSAFVSQVPVFFLATIGGTVADRKNRHHIVVATQIISMVLPLVLAALTFTASAVAAQRGACAHWRQGSIGSPLTELHDYRIAALQDTRK